MKILWKPITNADEYAHKVLALEADDIPIELINKGKWVLDELLLDQFSVDQDLINDHDHDKVHIARRDNFITLIRKQTQILPLIALGEKLFLVDGYARFRALKKLGVTSAKVIKQEL